MKALKEYAIADLSIQAEAASDEMDSAGLKL